MLTVLVATRNGVHTLPQTLTAYSRLEPPPGDWKLVIVDNGSTDGTRSAIAAFKNRLPLTYQFEPRLGKNAALNTGLASVSGDLVVLADDDTLPRSDWLVQMRAAADGHPSFSIFGGAVLPRWEVPPPDWILAWVPLAITFAVTDPSLQEGPTGAHTVFGPNMAVRAQVFQVGHRFDASIGPRGPNYPMGSEGEFVRRLIKQGHRAWHCQRAVVEHCIRKFQMEKSWILRRAIRYGRGQYRLGARDEPLPPHAWFGVPRHIFREMAGQCVQMAGAVVASDAERLFRGRWRFNQLRGQVIEARALHGERRRQNGPSREQR